jgi:predicted ABC-class ATPase
MEARSDRSPPKDRARDKEHLRRELERLEGGSYGSYKRLRGEYRFGAATLFIDRVQSDPFAAPSRLRVRVPMDETAFPRELQATPTRRLALADVLARGLARTFRSAISNSSGSGGSGRVSIDAGGQEVLERTAVAFEPATSDPAWVEARICVGLPASGRRARGREAARLLCDELVPATLRGLCYGELPQDAIRHFVECIENQEAIRQQLGGLDLVAFVANGSILPRESGASERPLPPQKAVPFQSPPSLEVEVQLPNPIPAAGGGADSAASEPRQRLRGMGVPRGVTLIVGGGYHGKSTLLRALERGIHPHVPGDGREYVISAPLLAKIRAEDGRAVQQVDISPFIGNLPGKDQALDPRTFSSEDASGSTSQAASIVEAIEAGATGLLLDEDTCATNFMLRDGRMQALVAADDEPITPFVDRVRELFEDHAISTVLVMGGSGAFFEAADFVIALRNFEASEVTDAARAIAARHRSFRESDARSALTPPAPRIPDPTSLDPSRGRRAVRVDSYGLDRIRFGNSEIDLRGALQLVDPSQLRCIGLCLVRLRELALENERSVSEYLDALEAEFDRNGLAGLDEDGARGLHPGSLARPRRLEIAAALNRLRTLRLR